MGCGLITIVCSLRITDVSFSRWPKQIRFNSMKKKNSGVTVECTPQVNDEYVHTLGKSASIVFTFTIVEPYITVRQRQRNDKFKTKRNLLHDRVDERHYVSERVHTKGKPPRLHTIAHYCAWLWTTTTSSTSKRLASFASKQWTTTLALAAQFISGCIVKSVCDNEFNGEMVHPYVCGDNP